MGRWRNHAAALAVIVSAGLALPAVAVTVSDMRALATAGEPLRLEIELADLFDTPEKDITITPAPADEHARLGMARPAWLDQLRFEIVRGDQGQVLARATGPQLAAGQRVSFLVQIGWPGHARLQQVSATALAPGGESAVSPQQPLVLPEPAVIPVTPSRAQVAGTTASDAAAEAVPAPDNTVIPADAAAAARATDPAAAQSVPVSGAAAVVPADGRTLTVRPGDTLSTLAQAWDADNLNLAQRQQLLRENNPRAFIAGDINRLRAGASLRLPAPDARPLATPAQAAAWLRRAVQGEAQPLSRPAEVAMTAAKSAKPSGADGKEVTLTLVAPGKGDQGRAAGEAAGATNGEALKTRDSLAAAEQARASLLAERKALSDKLQELTTRAGEQDARLKVLNERLAAFDQQAQANAGRDDVKAAMAAAAAKQKSGLSAETWVWIIFGGCIAAFVLLRLRDGNAAPVTAPEPPKSEYEEFKASDADELATPQLSEPAPEPASARASAAALASAPAPEFTEADVEDEREDSEYDFLSDSEAEAHQTRLDLAQAYIDMNEAQPARDLLVMVEQGGTAEQRRLASELLRSLG